MKRKWILSAILSTLIFSVFAELKYYEDIETGFSGKAKATYVHTDEESDSETWENMILEIIDKSFKEIGKSYSIVHKLTKEENFLLWQALDEYDCQDYEVYNALIATENRALVFYARICNNQESCEFVCLELLED